LAAAWSKVTTEVQPLAAANLDELQTVCVAASHLNLALSFETHL
jgi:hypothetical protein